MPPGKVVVLGLVTTKRGELEHKDDLKRRIEEASRHVPLDQLCLSPQCGFSSTVDGNDAHASTSRSRSCASSSRSPRRSGADARRESTATCCWSAACRPTRPRPRCAQASSSSATSSSRSRTARRGRGRRGSATSASGSTQPNPDVRARRGDRVADRHPAPRVRDADLQGARRAPTCAGTRGRGSTTRSSPTRRSARFATRASIPARAALPDRPAVPVERAERAQGRLRRGLRGRRAGARGPRRAASSSG